MLPRRRLLAEPSAAKSDYRHHRRQRGHFLRQFLLAVERDQRVQAVNFIASDSALRVMAEELDLKGRSNLIGQILGSAAILRARNRP